MGIVFGLLAAFGWGISDLCARFAGKKAGSYRAYLFVQPLGLILISLYLLIVPNSFSLEWPSIALAGGLGIVNCLAGLCLFRAFEVGTLSVVSPIASSYAAITLALGLATGERPDPVVLLGLFVTICGVVLASTQISTKDKGFAVKRGIGMALIAALLFGVLFWALKYVTPVIGNALPIWESRVVSTLLLLALAKPLGQTIGVPVQQAWPWIMAVGVLDTSAFLALTTGLTTADSGLVSVTSSLFSAVTVLLARLFLHEKLAPNQWAGVAGILAGIGMVSVG